VAAVSAFSPYMNHPLGITALLLVCLTLDVFIDKKTVA